MEKWGRRRKKGERRKKGKVRKEGGKVRGEEIWEKKEGKMGAEERRKSERGKNEK